MVVVCYDGGGGSGWRSACYRVATSWGHSHSSANNSTRSPSWCLPLRSAQPDSAESCKSYIIVVDRRLRLDRLGRLRVTDRDGGQGAIVGEVVVLGPAG